MENKVDKKTLALAMICGILGCFCYGGGDWLMIYGDTTSSGELFWLTQGASQIAPWRNGLAMLLAFPEIIFYGIALFYIGRFIRGEKERKIYHYLNAFGLTPWMCLHLFYIMILYLYNWMTNNGYSEAENCNRIWVIFPTFWFSDIPSEKIPSAYEIIG